MRFLPELLAQKSRLLLKMDLKEESCENYKVCLSLYKICRNKDEAEIIEKEIEDSF